MNAATTGQVIRFLIVGVGATVVHWAVYVLLNALFGLTAQNEIALSVTYATGYIVSFIGNYIASLRWTFRTTGSVRKGFGFAFSHIVNFGLHIGLLNLFLLLGLGELMVRVLQTLTPALTEQIPLLTHPDALLPLPVFCIVVPVNFLLVRYFLTRE